MEKKFKCIRSCHMISLLVFYINSVAESLFLLALISVFHFPVIQRSNLSSKSSKHVSKMLKMISGLIVQEFLKCKHTCIKITISVSHLLNFDKRYIKIIFYEKTKKYIYSYNLYFVKIDKNRSSSKKSEKKNSQNLFQFKKQFMDKDGLNAQELKKNGAWKNCLNAKKIFAKFIFRLLYSVSLEIFILIQLQKFYSYWLYFCFPFFCNSEIHFTK